MKEQRRIAEVLDRAAALRAKRRAALAQLDTLAQSIFLDLFGEPEHFEIAALREVAGLKRGPFGGALKKEIFLTHGYKVYEQRNAIQDDFVIGRYFISDSKYREMEDFAVLAEDLIVSCSGTLGKVAIVPERAQPGVINQALLRIRSTGNVTPLYLKYALESAETQKKLTGMSHGTGLQNFPPMSEIRSLRIEVPPFPFTTRLRSPRRRCGGTESFASLLARRTGRSFRCPPVPRFPRRTVMSSKETSRQPRIFQISAEADRLHGPLTSVCEPL